MALLLFLAAAYAAASGEKRRGFANFDFAWLFRRPPAAQQLQDGGLLALTKIGHENDLSIRKLQRIVVRCRKRATL